MRYLTNSLLLILALGVTDLCAGTIYIGPGEKFERISQAEESFKDGDIVEIVPGTYNDCAVLLANDLTIRPKGWPQVKKRVRFEDVACEGKAIFVVSGDNTRIEGIEFVNARVPDLNGAGIRLQGTGLFLQDTYFLNNEHGILSGDDHDSHVVINRSTFEKNGKCPPEWGHGIYFGEVGSLKVTNSKFIATQTGHQIKSRALYTEIIGNEITDGPDGTSSYLIDISNGGTTVIEDNIMQKGPHTENNSAAICIACEGEYNRGQKVIVRNNTFTNETGNEVVFVKNLTGIAARFDNNTFSGDRTVLVEGSAVECIPEDERIDYRDR